MQKTKIALASISALVLPALAFALPSGVPSVGSIDNLVTSIENFIWIIFGLIVVIAFITAGILFLTANGQAEKISSARSAFIWGVVGVVVGIIAYSIVEIVARLL